VVINSARLSLAAIATSHLGGARIIGKVLAVRIDNPPSVAPLKDAPLRCIWLRAFEYTDFPSWEAVSRRFSGLFDEARTLADDSSLRA
jgi:hypothetical protein